MKSCGAMSQENVERLRAAAVRGREDPEAYFGLFDPDVEWDDGIVDSGQHRGIDAVRQFFRSWWGTFEGIAFEFEEMIDAGDDVVTVTLWQGRGRASGAPVEVRVSQVWTFREGSVVRCRAFATREEALAAAGLAE